MKRLILLVTVTLLLLVGCASNDVRKMTFKPLRDFTIPVVETVELNNGMKLFLSEDHDYPTVSISMMFDGGSVYDPESRHGLSEMVGDMLSQGGSANYPADELKKILDLNAISLNSSFSARTGNYGISYLKDTEELALDILKDVLLNPVFDEEEMEILKMQQRESISRRNDDDSDVVFKEFQKLIYGADSPYASTLEYDDLNALERIDLLKFYTYLVHPSRIYVSIVGDFEKDKMVAKFEEMFGGWNPPDYIAVLELPEVPVVMESSVNYIDRPDATQSWILLGHMTEFTKDNPDYFPMIVMNQILGGGFNSRIFKKVRTEMGLAYSPGAYYSTNYEIPGIFYVMSQTKTEKTTLAIDALIAEVERMQSTPVTDLEIYQAKESFLNSYVFKYEKKSAVVGTMRTLDLFGYPTDFMQQIKAGVEKVTKEDVERVAKQYLHPDKFSMVILGNGAEFDAPLSKYGEVNTIDITIPEATSSLKEVSEEMFSAGIPLFADILSKMGDARNLNTTTIEGTFTQFDGENSRNMDYKLTTRYPDKIVRTIEMEGMALEMIFNGEQGVQKVMGQSMPLQKSQVRDQFEQSYENLLWVSKYRDQYQPYDFGEQEFNGDTFKVLGLRRGEREFWLLLDQNNELKGKLALMGVDMEVVTWFKELQTTPNGTIQTKDETFTIEGVKVQETEITDIKWNPEIDDSVFSVE
ncbi:MAG: pitrilysin family protein [Candidatus Zophobacter franzmannii]|nr:pitrilysin family protein [Candidatus Zophobacter franzmannii]